MRKILILFLLLQNVLVMRSQNNGEDINSQENKSYLPNTTPPSPQSFMFSEYGKNAIDEFNGKLNITIPIYNYVSGNLSLPVNLNYSGAGVKVNDISSYTGMNWILITGGVITRMVNDSPDEAIFPVRQYINYNTLITDATQNCRPYSQYYINLAEKNGEYDTEIDVWSFHFNGYSGKFYLDENYNPVYIENESEIKIEILGIGTNNAEKIRNSHSFLITTPDGVKYYFGGAESEATMLFIGHRGNSQLANTSFYLYKIEHPSKGEILIEYYNDQAALIEHGRSYKLNSSCGGITETSIPYYQIINSINQINNPKFIKKIKSTLTTEEVNFNYNFYNNRNYLASLESIEVKKNNIQLKKINFTYIFPLNIKSAWQTPYLPATRFFLQKIEIYNGSSTDPSKKETYKFDYEDPDHMPERLSPKQDLLGYFNNKNNETTIPKPSYFGNVSSISFGDLSPDFNYSKKGTLKKVTYPTGGYSVFDYEMIPSKKKKYKVYTSDWEGYSVPGYNSNDEYVDFTTVYETQTVPIIFYLTSAQPDLYHYCQASIKVTDLTESNVIPTIFTRSLSYNPQPINFNFTFVQGHQYKIEILPFANPSCVMEAKFSLTLFDGYEANQGLGVRLKSQKDYQTNNAFSNYKRYYYKNINSLNDDLYGLYEISYNPKYSFLYNQDSNCFVGYSLDVYSESSDIYSNKSFLETFDVVTTSYGGDNFENGGTEKYFYKQPNESNIKLKTIYDGCWYDYMNNTFVCGSPSTRSTGITFIRESSNTNEFTDLSVFNGKLLLERNFIKKDNQIFKEKEVIYQYEFNIRRANNAVNLVSRLLYGVALEQNFCPSTNFTPIKSLSDCFMAYYFIETFSSKLSKVIIKNYIDLVPLSQNFPYFTGFEQDLTDNYELHDINFNKVTQSETYAYGSLKGLPTEITSTTSESTVVNKTVNTYVNTASSLSGISSNQAAYYTSLLAQNRVASPVQTQQFKSGELLRTQRTLFNTFTANNTAKILPEKIQIAKGTQTLEDKAIFYNYDEQFNPVIVGYSDSPKTRYMYNTEGLVVAKIENYTGSTSNFSLVIGNLDNTSCTLQNQYPDALVTVYQYNLITKKVVKVTDPNCKNTYYEYDDLQHLKWIKDHDGNIVKEFDQQFKP